MANRGVRAWFNGAHIYSFTAVELLALGFHLDVGAAAGRAVAFRVRCESQEQVESLTEKLKEVIAPFHGSIGGQNRIHVTFTWGWFGSQTKTFSTQHEASRASSFSTSRAGRISGAVAADGAGAGMGLVATVERSGTPGEAPVVAPPKGGCCPFFGNTQANSSTRHSSRKSPFSATPSGGAVG